MERFNCLLNTENNDIGGSYYHFSRFPCKWKFNLFFFFWFFFNCFFFFLNLSLSSLAPPSLPPRCFLTSVGILLLILLVLLFIPVRTCFTSTVSAVLFFVNSLYPLRNYQAHPTSRPLITQWEMLPLRSALAPTRFPM